MGWLADRRMRKEARLEIDRVIRHFNWSIETNKDREFICGFSLADWWNNAVEEDVDKYLKMQEEYEALLMRDNLYNQSVKPYKSGKRHYLVLERREKFVEIHQFGRGLSSSAAGAGGLGLSATHLEVSKEDYEEYKKYIDYFKDVMEKNKTSNFGRATRNAVYKDWFKFDNFVKAFEIYADVVKIYDIGYANEYEKQLALSWEFREEEITPLFNEEEKKYLDNYQEVIGRREAIARKLKKMKVWV